MSNELISWNDVLKKHETTHQQLAELCGKDLQVFDESGNKVFATSQCERIPIEQPPVVWGRIVFDSNQDELVFENESIENERFKIKFFPKTGDFVLARNDMPLTIYDQNIFAHLMNVDFPMELTRDFFRKVHNAGSASYLPSSESEEYESLIDISDFEKCNKNNPNNEAIHVPYVIKSSDFKTHTLSIPYIICQKINRSKKKCNITFEISVYSGIDFSGPSPTLTQRDTEAEAIFYPYESDNISIRDKDYFERLQEGKIEISGNNFQLLTICINDSLFLAPRIDFLSENFPEFYPVNLKDENFTDKFYGMLRDLGLYSYYPIDFRLPEDTDAEVKLFNLQSILYAHDKTNTSDSEDEISNASNYKCYT